MMPVITTQTIGTPLSGKLSKKLAFLKRDLPTQVCIG